MVTSNKSARRKIGHVELEPVCYGKEKGQLIFFCGIDAQYQNSQEERDIKTIMCMASTFIIHIFFHWSECGIGYILLWSFVVNHAVCLYDRGTK